MRNKAFAGAAIVNTITVEKCLASASLRVEQEMAGALDGVLQPLGREGLATNFPLKPQRAHCPKPTAPICCC